jgi:aminobenzoyl-glutamate transport protein
MGEGRHDDSEPRQAPRPIGQRLLDWVERQGNKVSDPALLFVYALLTTWLLSAWLDGLSFELPSKMGPRPHHVVSQLTGAAFSGFLADMPKTFTEYRPLGVALVALLGVGVAERSGFISALLEWMPPPKKLLTPLLVSLALLSHSLVDAGYVLVIPLGGVIFYAVGRHPLAGIAAAFAGVSGGFSANPIPSGIDPVLQVLTQEAVRIVDPSRKVDPLCNWFFTGASCVAIVLVAWYLTDRVIEPRLKSVQVDGDENELPKIGALTARERKGMFAGLLTMAAGIVLLVLLSYPQASPMRNKAGELLDFSAAFSKSIAPLIFLLFLLPGLVHGYVSGTFKQGRDVVKGMSSSMSTMGYYLVLVFFASLFLYALDKSQLGALVAVAGSNMLQQLALPGAATVVGIVLLSGALNLVLGSTSAKWTLLAPIIVPMMMHTGLSPELAQAAYRVGDSSTNIVTPLMPYFPLVLVFARRYVKKTGIGTMTSMMLPYSVAFLVIWTLFLLAFWGLGIRLGMAGVYTYP